jgi:glutamate-1-semialdehyde 2,1-aminomutase
MLQYYLRQAGLALSWVGTGRMVFSLNYSEADFETVLARFIEAGQQMRKDGWWWSNPELTNRTIRRGILREVLSTRFRGTHRA